MSARQTSVAFDWALRTGPRWWRVLVWKTAMGWRVGWAPGRYEPNGGNDGHATLFLPFVWIETWPVR